ncbi:MAG TPA: hypothetical protein VMZ27_14850 [Candidatus Saccharimonadales bacterium]|nr:hypothetical protein [Candidatus Saccharimonadales bacterium]
MMKSGLIVALLFSLLLQARAAPVAYTPPNPSNRVRSVAYNWYDSSRARSVPIRIYYPAKLVAPLPVILFSHGLGGSRDDYSYLGRYWAGCGYIVVHLQHLGSDSSIWQNAPNLLAAGLAFKNAVLDVRNAINRPLDVTFALDQLCRLNATNGLFHAKLDTNNIGMAGHSFGGFTTMAIAGEIFMLPDGKERTFLDPRVKAGIQMSAPKSFSSNRLKYIYGRITIPIFHMTGTLDDSPIGETTAAERRLAFDNMTRSEEYLLNFKGGDHMIFSGRVGDPDPKDDEFQKMICRGSTAFWDAYLKRRPGAKEWLSGGAFQKELAENGILEKKRPVR